MRAAAQAGPVLQVLGHRQRRLHRVEVAHVVEPAAMRGPVVLQRLSVPGERAARGPEQAGEDAKQARLARAVGPREGERIARRQAKRGPGEDRALATDAGHVVRLEAGRLGRAVRRAGNLAPLSGRA